MRPRSWSRSPALTGWWWWMRTRPPRRWRATSRPASRTKVSIGSTLRSRPSPLPRPRCLSPPSSRPSMRRRPRTSWPRWTSCSDKRSDPVAQRIVMPSFGMYTAEGNLGRWLVPAGSTVEAGGLIVEVVTEKATYEVESPGSGILHSVAVEGENLTVEGLIGWILAEGEALPEDEGSKKAEPERIKASPIARRLAAEKGIDLASLTGSGPGGRIVEADVLAAAPAAPRESAWKIRERIPLTGARKTIAQRLRRSVDT